MTTPGQVVRRSTQYVAGTTCSGEFVVDEIGDTRAHVQLLVTFNCGSEEQMIAMAVRSELGQGRRG